MNDKNQKTQPQSGILELYEGTYRLECSEDPGVSANEVKHLELNFKGETVSDNLSEYIGKPVIVWGTRSQSAQGKDSMLVHGYEFLNTPKSREWAERYAKSKQPQDITLGAYPNWRKTKA